MGRPVKFLSKVISSLVFRSLSTNFIQLLLAVSLFGLGGSLISVGIPKLLAFTLQESLGQ